MPEIMDQNIYRIQFIDGTWSNWRPLSTKPIEKYISITFRNTSNDGQQDFLFRHIPDGYGVIKDA